MKIKIDPEKKITLYSREFDQMRHTLDQTLQSVIRQLIKKDMNNAGIGLKIDINLVKLEVADDNAPTGTRESVIPEINYKIAFVIQQKGDAKDSVVSKAAGKELLTDGSGDFFLVSKEEASGQLSMFNSWDEFEEALSAEGEEEDE